MLQEFIALVYPPSRLNIISISEPEPEPEPDPAPAPASPPVIASAKLTVHDGRPRAGSVKVFDVLDLEPGDLNREVCSLLGLNSAFTWSQALLRGIKGFQSRSGLKRTPSQRDFSIGISLSASLDYQIRFAWALSTSPAAI